MVYSALPYSGSASLHSDLWTIYIIIQSKHSTLITLNPKPWQLRCGDATLYPVQVGSSL